MLVVRAVCPPAAGPLEDYVAAEAYTPASHFPGKKADPEFRTKLQIAADLVEKALAGGVVCRAVVADSFYGDHDDLRGAPRQSGLGFVMALKPSRGTWQYGADAYTPKDSARAVPWGGPENPGGWHPVQRMFRDGHTETWWATDAQLGWWGPDGHTRLIITTTDPATLPDKATWYLVTNLARPGGPHDNPDAPQRAGGPERSRAALRDPALDRAKLQTSQGRTRLGRLPRRTARYANADPRTTPNGNQEPRSAARSVPSSTARRQKPGRNQASHR